MADLTGMLQAAAGGAGGEVEYLAVPHGGAPCFTLLKNSAGILSLASTYALPDTGRQARFSPDGAYIAVAHQGSPYFTLLDHSAGSVSLATTYVAGGGTQIGVDFTSDGNYIATCGFTDPSLTYVTLLSHSSGAVSFASSYNAGTFGLACKFSPDDNYLAVGLSNKLTILNRSGGTLSLASVYNTGSRQVNSIAFDSTGAYMAIGTSGSAPFFALLNFSAGTATLATTYAVSEAGLSVAFSRDDDYIAVGSSTSPYFTLLDHTTPGSVSLAATYTLSTSAIGVAFNAAGDYIALGSAPVVLLNYSSGSVTLAATYDLVGSNSGRVLDFSPAPL